MDVVLIVFLIGAGIIIALFIVAGIVAGVATMKMNHNYEKTARGRIQQQISETRQIERLRLNHAPCYGTWHDFEAFGAEMKSEVYQSACKTCGYPKASHKPSIVIEEDSWPAFARKEQGD